MKYYKILHHHHERPMMEGRYCIMTSYISNIIAKFVWLFIGICSFMNISCCHKNWLIMTVFIKYIVCIDIDIASYSN